ncbi:MAG: histidine phosphatase family protein [Candidatus Eisenbacteria bacterium]
MTEIVFVRHGETELNTTGVFRGRADVTLNERGLAQAGAVAAALSAVPVTAVYSSPMVRALDTARAVASPHGLVPVVDPAFDNIDLGQWQGVAKDLVRREQPELWRLWREDPDALRIPGGESLADVRERAYERTLELAELHSGKRMVIVSHRSVVKLLAGALLGMESGYFWRFYLDNAGYSVFGFNEGSFVMLRWNEACHLDERTVEYF